MEEQKVPDVTSPNAIMRQKLARQWHRMSEEEQVKLRSERARRGIKCKICGKLGYYRENCPNGCESPYTTDESDDEAFKNAGVGILWGDLAPAEAPPIAKKKRQEGHREVLHNLREKTLEEVERLKKTDKNVHSYDFFTTAEEGYSRNLAEVTLHQVMRRLMRLLEDQVVENRRQLEAVKDETLLHPPMKPVTDNFFTKELQQIPEYREYFYKKMKKAEFDKRNYRFRGNMRPVEDLGVYFRGTDDSQLFREKKNAGACVHSKIGWKDLTSTHDALASSDPAMIKKVEEVERLFAQQGQWVETQKKAMGHTNDRFEHLIFVLKEEMIKEHKREAELLLAAANKQENKGVDLAGNYGVVTHDEHTAEDRNAVEARALRDRKRHIRRQVMQAEIKTWVDRLESVDRILLTLSSYEFISGLDEVDFLMYLLRKWRNQLRADIERRAPGTITKENDESTAGNDETSMISSKKPIKKSKKPVVVGQMNPYEATLSCLKKQERKTAPARLAPPPPPPMITTTAASEEPAPPKQHAQVSTLVLRAITAASLHESKKGKVNPFLMNDEKSTGPMPSEKESATLEVVLPPPSTSLSVDPTLPLIPLSPLGNSPTKSKHSQTLSKKSTAPRKLTLQEKDQIEMKKAKTMFRRAGLGRSIRSGRYDDGAFSCPALIPIPGSFVSDDKGDEIKSHVADGIIYEFRKNLVLGDIGYTPQRLLPLYVRNTLMEKNGTTPGGDQTFETMGKDARYTTTFNRPLNRFEPPGQLEKHMKERQEARLLQDEKIVAARAERKRLKQQAMEEAKKREAEINARGAMNHSLVRLVFGSKHEHHYYD